MKAITQIELNTRISENKTNINPELYSKYHSLMTLYFIKCINLKEIDNLFLNSPLGFKKVSEDDMDVYQYLSSDYLNYFYIRNNLNLENLNEEELNFLKNKNDENFDNNTINFLNSTILKVINDNKKEELYSNVDNPNYIFETNKVIIGFRYDEFAVTTMEDDEWNELNEKQNEYIDKVIKEYQEKINNSNYPVVILKYSEFIVNRMKPIMPEY